MSKRGWVAFIAYMLLWAGAFWLKSIEQPVSPVAAPEAPLAYYVGDFPKPAPVTSWYTGRASFYGEPWRGRRTANGERFDPGAMTCAHKSLRFGTRLEISYGGKVVTVRVNDRGPYVAGRVLDLSEAAFAALAPVSRGVIEVSWRIL